MRPIRRVIFDTSTLVSAALRVGSVPHQALLTALCFCDVCASAETLAEIEVVFNRRKFDRYLNLEERQAFIANLHRSVRMFAVQNADIAEIESSCRDSRDDQFLALAQTAEADTVVSSDQDLLVLNPWRGVPIVTPAEFLAQLHGSLTQGRRI